MFLYILCNGDDDGGGGGSGGGGGGGGGRGGDGSVTEGSREAVEGCGSV